VWGSKYFVLAYPLPAFMCTESPNNFLILHTSQLEGMELQRSPYFVHIDLACIPLNWKSWSYNVPDILYREITSKHSITNCKVGPLFENRERKLFIGVNTTSSIAAATQCCSTITDLLKIIIV
jgi:hypothetical protein